jgi:hypothetical protein
MEALIAKYGDLLAVVLTVVLVLNALLSGVYKILDVIKDKTKTKFDNKLFGWIGKAIPFVQKAIDWLSANQKHKEEPKNE